MATPISLLSISAKRYEDAAAALLREAVAMLDSPGSAPAVARILSDAQWNLGTAAGLRAAALVLTTEEVDL